MHCLGVQMLWGMTKSRGLGSPPCSRVRGRAWQTSQNDKLNGGKTVEEETEFTTIQEVIDGAMNKFGGWSMSASEVINWIATELEALEERN